MFYVPLAEQAAISGAISGWKVVGKKNPLFMHQNPKVLKGELATYIWLKIYLLKH